MIIYYADGNLRRSKGMTLLEMVIALAMIVIICAAILPQIKTINDSWASKQANAEVLQNARVLVYQVNRSLSSADKIIDVSDPCETNGYIEFEDNTGTPYRFDIAANNYIEYGPVGSLSDFAGPVSLLKFTCYSKDDFTTPTTIADDIRFVKAEVIFPNPGPGQDKTFTTSAYLRTNSTIAGLFGWWKLDETSGLTAADSSGNDNHGTLNNMAGDEWTDGAVDGALEFDGSDDYIDGIGDCPTSSFTVLGWVKDTSLAISDWSALYSAEQEIWFGIDRTTSPSLWVDCGGNGKGAETAEGTWTKNVWHHIAATWDESDIHLYIDGVDMPITIYGTPENPQAKAAVIGAYSMNPTSETWYGELDDVRIYNRVLTPEEIASFIADFSVTPGTPFRFESVRVVQTPVLSKIDNTHYLCAYDTTSDGWATVLVVDTDTMTVTEETDYTITATGGMNPTLNRIDPTHYLYGHSDQAPDDDGWARVLQVNTSTWAITAAANYEYDSNYGLDQSIEQIDSTHYLCTYDGPGTDAYAVVLTVNTSDWTVTAGTPFVIDVGAWETSLEKIDSTHYFCGYLFDPGVTKGYAVVLEVNTSDWTVSAAGSSFKYDNIAYGIVLEPYDGSHIMSMFHALADVGWSRVFTVNTSTWEISKYNKYQVNREIHSFDFDRIVNNNYLYVTANPVTSKGEATVIEVDPVTYLTSEKVSLAEFGDDVNWPDVVQIDINHYLCVYSDTSGDGWAVIINVNAVSDFSDDDIMP